MPDDTQVLRFGAFELQPAERRLLADGRPVVLGSRAFDLLVVLAERPDRLVTRDELLDRVWKDLVVEDGNLAVQISTLRKVLGPGAIATVPGRGYRFTATVESGAPPRAPAPPAEAPAAEALHGRAADLALVRQALARHRVVTLVGPGGVGKTTLARTLAQAHDAPVAWVDGAALRDGSGAVARIAEALKITLPSGDDALPALVAALSHAPRGGAGWLVFDNAEHVGAAVAAIADAIVAGTALSLLVTSQVPLGIAGEQVLRIEPLAVAPADAGVADALAHGAVALFVDRARAAERRFELTPGRVSAVVEICRRLDGLPLAIEMAAARLPVLGLAGLQSSLPQRLQLLRAGPLASDSRHATLRSTLDWSHGLLEAAEQAVLRRCAVFVGGFTLELFTAVAGRFGDGLAAEPWQAIDALATLVARSLVVAEGLDTPRYRLLETVRAYALDKLEAAGERQLAQRRHAEAMRDFFAAQRAVARSGRSVHSLLPQCTPEFDNLDAAIAWAGTAAPALAVELATYGAFFTVFSPRRRDAERWLEACEPLAAGIGDASAHGRFLLELTRSRVLRSDPRAAQSARRALDVFCAGGDEEGEFQALGGMLRSAHAPDSRLDAVPERMAELLRRHPEWPPSYHLGAAGARAHWTGINRDYESALACRRDEAHWAAVAGNPPLQRTALSNVVNMLVELARHDEAIATGEALLESLQGQPDRINAAYTCLFLAVAYIEVGRFDDAAQVIVDGEDVMRSLDLPEMSDMFGWLAARRGWPRAAARLVGWADARIEARGVQRQSRAETRRDETLEHARSRLGGVAFEIEYGRGRAIDDAAARALLLARHDCGPGN